MCLCNVLSDSLILAFSLTLNPHMDFITSQRGQDKLCLEGYVYVKHKELLSSVTSYYCERRQHKNCKASVKICEDEVVGQLHEHNHASDIHRQDVLSLCNEIKEKSTSMQETSQKIITQAVENISEGAAVNLTAVNNIRRSIRRYRQVLKAPYPIPRDLIEMVILDEYKRMASGEDFHLYDSVSANERLLIFTTTNMNLLKTSTDWFCDATLKLLILFFTNFILFTV